MSGGGGDVEGPREAALRPVRPGRPGDALSHPLRLALLGLLSRNGTVTATQAARELGESSGACSFHLRQLERYGHVEAVPGIAGRARPWRLATATPRAPVAPAGGSGAAGASAGWPGAGDEFGALARELENEGYRRWLDGRGFAPQGWTDAAFSTIVHLTPAELAELAQRVRAVIAAFAADREPGPGRDPQPGNPGTLPVAVVARMFPLLPAGPAS